MKLLPEPRLTLVVARAANGVIGADGAIPWRAPTDMARFKALTLGKPVIMGRKTWASLKRALPRRRNIVLTRQVDLRFSGAWAFTAWDVAKAAARAMAFREGADDICIIGGAEIYALALPEADRIELTEIAAEPDGDTLFPDPDPAEWREVAATPMQRTEKDTVDAVFRTLERKSFNA